MICRSPLGSCRPVWPSGLCFQRDRHLSSPVESRPASDLEPPNSNRRLCYSLKIYTVIEEVPFATAF